MSKLKRPKLLFDKDKWMVGEHIPDMDLFFQQIFFSSFANNRSYAFIKRYKKVVATYKKFEDDFYFGTKDSFEVGESILKALLERPGFGKEVDNNIIKWSDKLISFGKKVSKLPLRKYSNKKLWDIYNEHDRIHTKLYTYGWLPVAVDMFHNNFTDKLKSYLYAVCESKSEAEEAFVVLTTPSKKSILASEREEFLAIYEKYKKFLKKQKQLPEKLTPELKKHSDRWGHLGYIYAGNVKPFGVAHYLEELYELKETGIKAEKILSQEDRQLKIAKKKQTALYKALKISSQYKKLFGTAQDFALSKLVRRHAQLLTLYILHTTLLTEIAKRLKLSRYQVQFMLKDEVREALVNNKVERKVLAQRLKHCVLYVEHGFEKVYLGKMEQKIRSTINVKVDKNITEFSGQTAQPGFATGVVKIIIRAKDMGKMQKGDILVSIATDPDVVPAMKKAAAIITEQGGITSHAAIVSRELGTPCIIGTKIATKILKDGDIVEVDANKGTVRKIS
jgi:phosphohistidine swiveling domain-containing protein